MLFGYLIRLGLIFLAVLLVKDAAWISLPALGATIIVTHLGLLVWELRYVAISLAYPGLKPARPSTTRSTTRNGSRTCSHSSSRRSTNILRWQDIFPTFNKVALIAVARRADRHRRSSCSPAARIR